MFWLQAIPFFPGHAQGVLHKGLAGHEAAAVALVTQQDLPLRGPSPSGVIVAGGAPFSHPMLRLRALGVPIVLIEARDAQRLPYGETVALDGTSGVISSQPVSAPFHEPPAAVPGGFATTADGVDIELCASVGNRGDAAMARAKGAAAIGLLRSEYLLPPSSQAPDAGFLKHALREVCDAAFPLPVTVRLLDLAADKCPPWLDPPPGLAGACGLQGVRLYDFPPIRAVLEAQLDALAALLDEAAAHKLSVLVPYLTRLEELERWRAEIGARLPRPLPVGAMLETPAAALAVADWLSVADFVALGCNDLMQGLFAADRDQAGLAPLLDPYSPVLYRFLRWVAHEAADKVARILVCGLLPQLPGALPLLLGLGYRRFSVDPMMIPWLVRTINSTSVRRAGRQAAEVCKARLSSEVGRLVGLPVTWAGPPRLPLTDVSNTAKL